MLPGLVSLPCNLPLMSIKEVSTGEESASHSDDIAIVERVQLDLCRTLGILIIVVLNCNRKGDSRTTRKLKSSSEVARTATARSPWLVPS